MLIIEFVLSEILKRFEYMEHILSETAILKSSLIFALRLSPLSAHLTFHTSNPQRGV